MRGCQIGVLGDTCLVFDDFACLFFAQQPRPHQWGAGPPSFTRVLDHTQRRTTLLWTSDQLVAETST